MLLVCEAVPPLEQVEPLIAHTEVRVANLSARRRDHSVLQEHWLQFASINTVALSSQIDVDPLLLH